MNACLRSPWRGRRNEHESCRASVSDADLFEIGVSQNGPLWAPNDIDGQAQGRVRGANKSNALQSPSIPTIHTIRVYPWLDSAAEFRIGVSQKRPTKCSPMTA